MADIVLCTLNARFQHTAFGLRCLRANLGDLRERSTILEFDLTARPSDVVEQILALRPRIVGLGVYVWNVGAMAEVTETLAAVAPGVAIVLGGPEVSHELEAQPWTRWASAVVKGEGEWHFGALCRTVLDGQALDRSVLPSVTGALSELELPYAEYTDADLAHRVLYVEASRGCPFSCEFCLSALDERVRPFPIERLLSSLSQLLERGALHFKFVDRTFNLDVKASARLLEFFLDNLRPGLFLHFEMVPDRFPPALRALVQRFPPGTLQFEVGIQTFDLQVAQNISRRLDVEKTSDNLRFLAEAQVHVHADLIAGLPAETLQTFAAGFDRLLSLSPQEIQVGILKRLRGAPIARHTQPYRMVYASRAPYEVMQTSTMSFSELQHLKRFAAVWDQVANSGNFVRTLPLLLGLQSSPFDAFSGFVRSVSERFGRTNAIALLSLARALFEYLNAQGVVAELCRAALLADYQSGGRHEVPGFLSEKQKAAKVSARNARQLRHLSSD